MAKVIPVGPIDPVLYGFAKKQAEKAERDPRYVPKRLETPAHSITYRRVGATVKAFVIDKIAPVHVGRDLSHALPIVPKLPEGIRPAVGRISEEKDSKAAYFNQRKYSSSIFDTDQANGYHDISTDIYTVRDFVQEITDGGAVINDNSRALELVDEPFEWAESTIYPGAKVVAHTSDNSESVVEEYLSSAVSFNMMYRGGEALGGLSATPVSVKCNIRTSNFVQPYYEVKFNYVRSHTSSYREKIVYGEINPESFSAKTKDDIKPVIAREFSFGGYDSSFEIDPRDGTTTFRYMGGYGGNTLSNKLQTSLPLEVDGFLFRYLVYEPETNKYDAEGIPEERAFGTMSGTGVLISENDEPASYHSIALEAPPYLRVMSSSHGTASTLDTYSAPSVLPTGPARFSTFDDAGEYLGVAYDTEPYFTAYRRSGLSYAVMPSASGYTPISSPAFGVKWEMHGSGYMSVVVLTRDYPFYQVYLVIGNILYSITEARSYSSRMGAWGQRQYLEYDSGTTRTSNSVSTLSFVGGKAEWFDGHAVDCRGDTYILKTTFDHADSTNTSGLYYYAQRVKKSYKTVLLKNGEQVAVVKDYVDDEYRNISLSNFIESPWSPVVNNGESEMKPVIIGSMEPGGGACIVYGNNETLFGEFWFGFASCSSVFVKSGVFHIGGAYLDCILFIPNTKQNEKFPVLTASSPGEPKNYYLLRPHKKYDSEKETVLSRFTRASLFVSAKNPEPTEKGRRCYVSFDDGVCMDLSDFADALAADPGISAEDWDGSPFRYSPMEPIDTEQPGYDWELSPRRIKRAYAPQWVRAYYDYEDQP